MDTGHRERFLREGARAAPAPPPEHVRGDERRPPTETSVPGHGPRGVPEAERAGSAGCGRRADRRLRGQQWSWTSRRRSTRPFARRRAPRPEARQRPGPGGRRVAMLTDFGTRRRATIRASRRQGARSAPSLQSPEQRGGRGGADGRLRRLRPRRRALRERDGRGRRRARGSAPSPARGAAGASIRPAGPYLPAGWPRCFAGPGQGPWRQPPVRPASWSRRLDAMDRAEERRVRAGRRQRNDARKAAD